MNRLRSWTKKTLIMLSAAAILAVAAVPTLASEEENTVQKHAVSATVTVGTSRSDAKGLNFINDGKLDRDNCEIATTEIVDDDYFLFTWDDPISVNQVILSSQYCNGGQAPTAWKVLVSEDGTTWKEVGSVSDAGWADGDDLQSKELVFERQENVKAVKVQITAANLTWGKYTISELEINDDPDAKTSPDTGERFPLGVGLLAGVSSAAIVVSAMAMNRRRSRRQADNA